MSWSTVLAFDTNGYPVAINNVGIMSLPPVQGINHSFLHNDGLGNWSWQTIDYSWIIGEPVGPGHQIKDEGAPLTQRASLNFVGAGITATDDAGNNATIVTVPGGAGVSGSGTNNKMTKWTGAGSIGDATNDDTEVTSAVSLKHTQGTDVALGTLSTKNPPIDADKAIYRDSTSSDALVTSTWTQVKAFLKTYFDGIYLATVTVHNLLSATHGDTLTGSVLDGDVVIGNVTPKWSRLGITVPAANILNVLGVANGETRPSWKSIFDATNPAALGAVGPGTSLIAAHRDHIHPTTGLALGATTIGVSGLGLSGGGDLSANRTITLASSNNPGAAAAILATDANGGIALDTTTLVVDAVNHRVGVCTASPVRPFHLIGTDGAVPSFPTIGAKDQFIIENNANANLALISGATAATGLKFYISGAASELGQIGYDNSSGYLYLNAGGATHRVVVLANGNTKIAGSALRGTTEGTNHLDIFDGTAPVGTLANGVSLYSATGALGIMDAAGGKIILSDSKISTYNSIATEGYGVGAIVDDVALTGQTGNIVSTNFTNANVAGTYLISLYGVVTTANAIDGVQSIQFAFTDNSGAQTTGGGVLLLNTLGARSYSTFIVRLASGSISWSVTLTSGGQTTSRYALYMTCMRLS